MTDPAKVAVKLMALKLFTDFTLDEIDALTGLADQQVVSAGGTIVRQDDAGDSMYVLVDGEAVVTHRKDSQSFELARLRDGDFFGEIALVDEGPRSADVVAVTDCKLVQISQGTIRALAGVYPAAAFKLMLSVGRVLVERLRAGNRKYIDSLLIRK